MEARKHLQESNLSEILNVRNSQRIIKVVNIIGSQNKEKDGSLSSNRISLIRARQYKSKGEKISFKHTGSRE